MADNSKFTLGPFALLAGLLTLLLAGSRRNIERRKTQQSLGRLPARKLSASNAIGILVALSQPLIVERYLQTLTLRHQLLWPMGNSIIFDLSLAISFGIIIGGLTYVSLDRSRAGGRNSWVAPLWIGLPVICLSLFFRWGNWPHMGMLCWGLAFGVLSYVFVVSNKARYAGPDPNSIESLKAKVSTWQSVTASGLTAYLAFIIFQLYIVWLVAQDLVKTPQERVLFFAWTGCQLAVFSVLIFIGPFRQTWDITFDSLKKLAEMELLQQKETYRQLESRKETKPVVEFTPTPTSAEATPVSSSAIYTGTSRDWIDKVLAAVQVLTLISLIVYVIKTADIASSTKNAAEAARDAANVARASAATQTAVTLIDQLYSDQIVQDTLELIYTDSIRFKNENGIPEILVGNGSHQQNVERQLSVTLNRMQTLGLLYNMGVLKKEDLIGLRYEVLALGRNKAVREYFNFLNTDYQRSSGITHDHYKYLKELYLVFEKDPSQQREFQKYIFIYPPGSF